MFTAQIELYNYPTSYRASAEPRESGIRVMVEDTSTSFMDILKDSSSVAYEISWGSYSEDGGKFVRHMAHGLAKQLLKNQLAVQK